MTFHVDSAGISTAVRRSVSILQRLTQTMALETTCATAFYMTLLARPWI